jgi:hypothetical protein
MVRWDRVRSSRWRGPGGAVGLLVVLTLFSFHHQIFDGWSFPWDFESTPTTTPAFIASTFGRGNFLSWTPFVASGFPAAIDPQAGVYFPLWWIFGLLRVPLVLQATTDVQVFMVTFGACGVLALARARGLAWKWAVVAAAAYLFFGGFYGESEHTPYVFGFTDLPWLLWSLTPPRDGTGRWTRLIALPFVSWLIAAGAYPGDIASFGIVGAVYLVLSLRASGGEVWRRYRVPLLLLVLATAAVLVAVVLPYYNATQTGQLWRPYPPAAAVRAGFAIHFVDFLGLYLNPFAWHEDGTIQAWAIGTPVLIGVFLLRWRSLRRHAPLVGMGLVSLVLAMTPAVDPIGRLMAGPLKSLFPTRFPAADYKAAIAIMIVLLSVESWSALADGVTSRRWTAAVGGALLIVGAVLAPSTFASPTRTVWLLAVVVVAAVALVLTRPSGRVLACVLLALVVIDGWRDARDDLLLNTTSSWLVPPADATAAGMSVRDTYIRKLPQLLSAKPAARPARVAPAAPLAASPQGTNNDTEGWIAEGYHLIDYGGTVERVLHEVEENPTWTKLMLASWHAYAFPCAQVGCVSGKVHLPSATTWTPTADVQSVSYSATGITYSVRVATPMLMVENELAIVGWRGSTRRVRLIDAGIPLRAWRLAPGTYHFTATYHSPTAKKQLLAAGAAILLALAGGILVWRRRQLGRNGGDLPTPVVESARLSLAAAAVRQG